MNLDELCRDLAAARWDYATTLAPDDLAAAIARNAADPDVVADVKQVLATLAAYGDPHAEALLAGREVGAPCRTSTEYSVRWHTSDDMTGILMDRGQMPSLATACREGAAKIGKYGITCFSVHRCEHRQWDDGSTWIGPDVFVAGPLITAEIPEAAA